MAGAESRAEHKYLGSFGDKRYVTFHIILRLFNNKRTNTQVITASDWSGIQSRFINLYVDTISHSDAADGLGWWEETPSFMGPRHHSISCCPACFPAILFSPRRRGERSKCKRLHPVFVRRSAKTWTTTEGQNVPATFQPSRASSRCSRAWCSSVCEQYVLRFPLYVWTSHVVLSVSIFTHGKYFVLNISCSQSTSCSALLAVLRLFESLTSEASVFAAQPKDPSPS